ncbi:hypothetical protein M8C21_023174 [Ambrosia artemisiifolia]|uniref:Uncharacterized protein n=1 Tax=Ambrosia artemisiifolia TaxID=4212 RepID=A0AAD5DFB6_AMBAR|nr:hypothetical protein M8C21_023174 [Ambrosia artemisiifolia]
MNAQALKKFVEENRKLIIQHDDLLTRSEEWEDECLSYERDIEALMDFGNQAHERAEEAECRVRCLQDETSKLWEELKSFKQLSEGECTENFLIDTLISSLINTEEVASASHSFLEANSQVDVCEKMLEIWDSLTPSAHHILALASEVKNLQKDKDMLRMNLIKAEEEVEALFDENNALDEEYTRLTNLLDSEGIHVSGSIKNFKRKSSSAVEKNNDFSDAAGSPRKLLSRCYITQSPCNLI